MSSSPRLRPAALAAVAAVVVAWTYLLQPSGDNQKAHYLLVRALAEGRATVDEARDPSSPLATGDVVRFEGHDYAAKAPGLAAAALPAYVVARAAGVSTEGDPVRMLWALHLWAVVLPGAALLLLVLAGAERLVRHTGAATAVTLGLATLLLPFGTLLFAHVLAAALGFAAFMLLWRDTGARPAVVSVAGLLAGFAVTTDYPLALVAVLLGLFLLTDAQGRVRRALAYGAGLLAGAAPLFLYNLWAFGSALHFPYEGWHERGAEPLSGVFGITAPSLRDLLTLLFVPAGLAALAPAVAGIVLLVRGGERRVGFLLAGVGAGFLFYNAGFVDLYGGASPGPRYMIPALPFLALGLAPAFRALPAVTVGIAAGAATVLALYTLTTPLAAWDGNALERLRDGAVVASVGSELGVPGPWHALPFVLAVLAAGAFAAWDSGLRRVPAPADLGKALVALGAWSLVAWRAPSLLFDPDDDRSAAVLLLVAAAGAAVALLYARPLARAGVRGRRAGA